MQEKGQILEKKWNAVWEIYKSKHQDLAKELKTALMGKSQQKPLKFLNLVLKTISYSVLRLGLY